MNVVRYTKWCVSAIMNKLFPKLPINKRAIRRIKKRSLVRLDSFFAELEAIANIRSGNKASRIIRKILERVNIKTILGGNIALLMITSSILGTGAQDLGKFEAESRLLPELQAKLTTQIKLRFPLERVVLNQRFSIFHRGVDLDGEIGNPIYPIMNGVVESHEYGKFGYGNNILVNHQNGFKSRYAHLSKIEVKDGQEVTTGTVLGRVGSTGHSTGPHLHLEIYHDTQTLNPLTVLGPIPVKSASATGGK